MKRINTRGKITSTPPSILPAAALLISNTNYNTGTHTQTHRRTQTLQIHLHFLSRFFFCEMFDRLHQCKKWSRGERERQNGWDSRKERGSATREQETEKKEAKRKERGAKERWREQVFPLSTCHFTDPRYERQTQRRNNKNRGCALPKRALPLYAFLPLVSSLFLFILLSLSFLFPLKASLSSAERQSKCKAVKIHKNTTDKCEKIHKNSKYKINESLHKQK